MTLWEYKTIHCGLKKEGLLGSAFLDENDIEDSLNEYGRLGWELISLLEVRDGIIAVLKRPVPEQCAVVAGEKLEQPFEEEVDLVSSSGAISSANETALLSETDLRAIFTDQEEQQEDENVVEDGEAGMKVIGNDDSRRAHRQAKVESGASLRDIGAIRIE